MSTQCIFWLVRSFIDPTFCGIFVCGPSQFKGHEVACVGSVSVWFQSKDSLRSMAVLVGRAK